MVPGVLWACWRGIPKYEVKHTLSGRNLEEVEKSHIPKQLVDGLVHATLMKISASLGLLPNGKEGRALVRRMSGLLSVRQSANRIGRKEA